MNAGITRIRIDEPITGRGAWRFKRSRQLWPPADILYTFLFNDLGMPLAPGVDIIKCSKKEFEAGYDIQLGIDVFLRFAAGQTATMQEKFLFTHWNTVTVEYYQNWQTQEPGDWFNLKCQYYFVGYDHPWTGTRFSDWILLDWSRTVQATNQGRLEWGIRQNQEDGARASFKYAEFDTFPPDTVVARMNKTTQGVLL